MASRSVGVAGVASGGSVDVIAHTGMVRVGARLIVGMASDAGKDLKVARIGVAIGASGPCVRVRSGIDGKLAVSGRRARPTGGGVTCRAGCWVIRRGMIRIVGCLILRLMARVAVGGSAGEHIVDVAGSAGHGDMGAGKRERCVVVVERSGAPCRCGMADIAGLRVAARDVVGIGSVVVVRQMAGDTSRAQAGELTISMACGAHQRDMRAGESEAGLGVIENRAEPVGGGMAERAILGECRDDVIGIGGLVELGEMTPLALGRRSGELTVQVALRAGRADVGAGERESHAGVIEG